MEQNKYCLQHILDLKKHKTGITKFKNELQKTKNQLVPMYLKENQRKKLSTANMVTSLSSATKSQNMHSIKLLYIKLSGNQQVFCTQIFIPMEKHDRYVLYVLDKYKHKVHIIDPRETTPEEFEKEKENTIGLYLKIKEQYALISERFQSFNG